MPGATVPRSMTASNVQLFTMEQLLKDCRNECEWRHSLTSTISCSTWHLVTRHNYMVDVDLAMFSRTPCPRPSPVALLTTPPCPACQWRSRWPCSEIEGVSSFQKHVQFARADLAKPPASAAHAGLLARHCFSRRQFLLSWRLRLCYRRTASNPLFAASSSERHYQHLKSFLRAG